MNKTEIGQKVKNIEKELKELKKELKVMANMPLLKLADYSWAEIADIIKNKKGTFAIGDAKQIELITGEVVTAKVIGLNHDDKSDGSGKAAITFYIEDLEAEYRWNETNTNEGGWRDCLMRNKTMPILFNSFPEVLRNSIVKVDKKTTLGDRSKEIAVTKDKLFVLSVSEHGMSKENAKGYASSDEGEQYEYFKKNDIDKKRWWTAFRSPCLTFGAYFCTWNYIGYVNGNTAAIAYRVALCFCL